MSTPMYYEANFFILLHDSYNLLLMVFHIHEDIKLKIYAELVAKERQDFMNLIEFLFERGHF